VGNHSRNRSRVSSRCNVASDSQLMQTLRRLSFAALVLGFAQIVFGAIVRITGSGLGCGDHWPKCAGMWFPPFDRIDLIIEITHRYIALGLSFAILALFVAAFQKRDEPGVGGAGGVLRPATIAGLLVVTAALLGAVTVKMALNPFVIATHLTIAMSLLATLAIALARAGGLGIESDMTGATPRTFRSARAAVGLTLVVIIFGALTANVPNAAASCGGFPWCRTINAHGSPLVIQVTHRILAFLLFGHLLGMAIGTGKRGEPSIIRRTAWIAFSAAVVQIIVAAGMIEMHFPPAFRSLHQAFGTLVWLCVVSLAILTKRAGTPLSAEPAVRKAA
jgi:cytochrome c oxidase assembly protein subunit 15